MTVEVHAASLKSQDQHMVYMMRCAYPTALFVTNRGMKARDIPVLSEAVVPRRAIRTEEPHSALAFCSVRSVVNRLQKVSQRDSAGRSHT